MININESMELDLRLSSLVGCAHCREFIRAIEKQQKCSDGKKPATMKNSLAFYFPVFVCGFSLA